MSRIKSDAIAGYVKPGFEAVREAFLESFTRRHELGAACCIYYRGETVVDLWGRTPLALLALQMRQEREGPLALLTSKPGYGYVLNRMNTYLADPRDLALRDAMYRSISKPHFPSARPRRARLSHGK